MPTPTDPAEKVFTLPEMNHELEKLWIELRREERQTSQFQFNIKSVTMLNTAAIILLALAALIVLAMLRQQHVIKKENNDHG